MHLKEPLATPSDPRDVSVQMNLRVPYHYREQLVAEAKRQGMSINRFLINLLVRSLPPER
jgi:predicted HicB family RNase H-like nuclease